MRKLVLLLLISSKLCLGQDNLYDLAWIYKIDQESVKGDPYDILEDFTKEELPDIFRLATVLCTPYFIDDELVKLNLEYQGDRETIFESFYYDNNQNIYFISYSDSYYSPPKWDDKSEIVLETKLNYFKESNSWKSIGVDCKVSKRLLNVMSKLKQLNNFGSVSKSSNIPNSDFQINNP